MTTTAWFHCFNGIAGDMALGALLDAGADEGAVRHLLGRLPVDDWTLDVEPVTRGGIAATRAVVTATDSAVERDYSVIVDLIRRAELPARVETRALATFAALAVVEGRIHRRDPAHVHFHEVGGIDAIIDIVGTCAALEVLGVDDVRSSPVAMGTGTVRAAHGELPNPAPAALELLIGRPVRGVEIDLELTTPTGAALLAALASGFGALPALTIASVGYGAGGRELPGRPNVTQVVVGDTVAVGADDGGQPVMQLEANVDDATGEVLAHTIDALLHAGAHDAWITPIVMKKGRPAHTVHALCDATRLGALRDVLINETGTLGVRATRLDRWPQARRTITVDVDGQAVRLKISASRVKVEHDDARAAALALGVPLRDVLHRAEQLGRAAEPS
jgi:pyridinium-3,5-bisthiocarboxylic acid mononucleotide nickel chelatase